MICQLCFEKEAVKDESLCNECKETNLDDTLENMEELIESIDNK